MKKGISPLVAAVILIAATMTIAGILSYWASSFVRTRLTSAENTTEGAMCQAAQFSLYAGSYDNTTEILYIILENQRNIDLELDSLYAFYPNNFLQTFPLNGTLKGNELKSFNISGIPPGFNNGKIKTTCPEISVDFTNADGVIR